MSTLVLQHTAFFKFTPIPDPVAMAQALREAVLPTQLLGNILVAHEGINGVLAGPPDRVAAFEQVLRTAPAFAAHFSDITFKHSDCTTPPFGRLKVHAKPQVVAVGLPTDKVVRQVSNQAPHEAVASVHVDPETLLSPQAWRELLGQPNVVVLDNRNSFEFDLGHFRRAIDPGVHNFRDFPAYVQAHAADWKAQGQRVAMYCTGGIRCEKTSAWMQGLGLDVVQLEGGILNYFQTIPDADKDWSGECFVFDNRIALNTQSRETATTLEDVYADQPDGEWRLARARRLQADVSQADT
jgi:UPF0176 protein